MTKIFNFALKIKGGGREGGTCEVLRPCHPPKIWNVHLNRCVLHLTQNWSGPGRGLFFESDSNKRRGQNGATIRVTP